MPAMSALKIVFLDKSTVPVGVRRPQFDHEWLEYESTSTDKVVERLKDATIAFTNKVRLTEEVLKQLPKLKLIVIAATGYDNVDVSYCKAHKIGVANIPGYAHDSVPEHVIMMMLALRRNLPAVQKAIAAGLWQKSPIPNLLGFTVRDMRGAVLGLVGYGDLARGVEQLARGFRMEVLIAERKNVVNVRPGRVLFREVLERADILSIHSPLMPETQGLIGKEELAMMKKGAILINTARGGVVDEPALAEALRSRHLGGAGLDVLSTEPPAQGNPMLDPDLPNVIVTPHIAWTSQRALNVLAEEVILIMESFARGEQRNRVV